MEEETSGLTHMRPYFYLLFVYQNAAPVHGISDFGLERQIESSLQPIIWAENPNPQNWHGGLNQELEFAALRINCGCWHLP